MITGPSERLSTGPRSAWLSNGRCRDRANDRLLGGKGADELFARVGFGREKDVVSGGASALDMAWVDRGMDTVNRDVEVRR